MEQDWMLCMTFAALGVALGSFLSSACPAFFALSVRLCKDVSAGCRKASSASCPSRTHGLQLCRRNAENMKGQRQTPFDTCESQLGLSQRPIDGIEKLNQNKSALDSCHNELNVLQHQSNVSQHSYNGITKLDQGRNDLDSCESHPDVSWHPSLETQIPGSNHVQSSDLAIHSSIHSKEFTLPNDYLKPDPFDPSKRRGYLSWDDYFMAIAFLSAHRSKDPNRQVGACLVSQDRVILGIGYNGFPRGCSDDELPWAKMSVDGNPLQTKYPYVCHAEVNAILNKNHASACGQRLYVTLFPCNECAKIIIQGHLGTKCNAMLQLFLGSLHTVQNKTQHYAHKRLQAGVAEVVYFVGKNSSLDCSYVASRKLLSMAGVKVWQHQPAQQKVTLDFK